MTPPLLVGSLFSGIEGIGLGFERAGATVAWHCEIDPDARAVLEEHFPFTPRYDDVRAIHGAAYCPDGGSCERCVPAVDVLVGGFPCQDLSVAGRRAGLAGARSGLFHEFMRLAVELAPRWLLIENVPGLLSSGHKPDCTGYGRPDDEWYSSFAHDDDYGADAPGTCGSCAPGADMGTVLDTLADLGYGWAYRVLDAQYFGVAQRRRRVFIVGCTGDTAGAAQVLFEPESCDGDPAPSREARAGAATGAAPGAQAGGSGRVAAPVLAAGEGGRRSRLEADGSNIVPALAHPVNAAHNDRWDVTAETYVPDIVPQALSCKWAKGSSGPAGDEHHNLVPVEAHPVNRQVLFRSSPEFGQGADLRVREMDPDEPHPTLVSNAGQYIGDRGVFAMTEAPPAVVYRKAQKAHDPDDCERWEEADTVDTISSHSTTSGSAVVQSLDLLNQSLDGEVAHTLRGGGGEGTPALLTEMAVRRLTPRECERLQGFPDDWTARLADSARYRVLGNAVCVPVAEWIARRMVEADRG